MKRFALIAQLVEHRPYKAGVLGSSPSGRTKKAMVSWIAQWYCSKDSEHRPVKPEDIGSIPT